MRLGLALSTGSGWSPGFQACLCCPGVRSEDAPSSEKWGRFCPSLAPAPAGKLSDEILGCRTQYPTATGLALCSGLLLVGGLGMCRPSGPGRRTCCPSVSAQQPLPSPGSSGSHALLCITPERRGSDTGGTSVSGSQLCFHRSRSWAAAPHSPALTRPEGTPHPSYSLLLPSSRVFLTEPDLGSRCWRPSSPREGTVWVP